MNKIDLRLGNCLEILPTFESKSVDAIITDLPYGNETEYGANYQDTQENLQKLIAVFMPEALRIAKRMLIACGVGNVFLYPKPTWMLSWFWDATTSTGKWGFNTWQPILVYGQDPYLQNRLGRHQDSKLIPFDKKNKWADEIAHPCPKPINVMRWLVGRGSLPNETVLDPFMGSGTTALACLQLQRNFIGIEQNIRFFDFASERIAEAQKQELLIKSDTPEIVLEKQSVLL